MERPQREGTHQTRHRPPNIPLNLDHIVAPNQEKRGGNGESFELKTGSRGAVRASHNPQRTWKAKEKEMLAGMEKKYRDDFIKGLRERQEYEVPNQSGICLIRGFIADNGAKPFEANTGVRFARQTDMRLEMLHGTVLKPGELTLLERDIMPEKSALAKIFKTAGYRTVRQGRRTVNGMAGTEKLIKWQRNKYMLMWEKDGDDPRIMMQFSADTAEGAKRSEAEILAIWDTVLPTLKPIR